MPSQDSSAASKHRAENDLYSLDSRAYQYSVASATCQKYVSCIAHLSEASSFLDHSSKVIAWKCSLKHREKGPFSVRVKSRSHKSSRYCKNSHMCSSNINIKNHGQAKLQGWPQAALLSSKDKAYFSCYFIPGCLSLPRLWFMKFLYRAVTISVPRVLS